MPAEEQAPGRTDAPVRPWACWPRACTRPGATLPSTPAAGRPGEVRPAFPALAWGWALPPPGLRTGGAGAESPRPSACVHGPAGCRGCGVCSQHLPPQREDTAPDPPGRCWSRARPCRVQTALVLLRPDPWPTPQVGAPGGQQGAPAQPAGHGPQRAEGRGELPAVQRPHAL